MAGVEIAPRGASDNAPRPEAPHKVGGDATGTHRPVQNRGGAVVKIDQLRDALADLFDQRPDNRLALGIKVRRDPARHDAVAHEAMAEGGFCCAKNLFAQHAHLRQHHHKGGIVADPADIAQVIGQPFQFGHQPAQGEGPFGHRDRKRRLGRLCEGARIGHRAVAGGAPGKFRAARKAGPGHQPVDPLVGIAKPLFQPHHRLALRGKAEMPRLDDAGMNGANRHPMQAFALHGQEGIGRRPGMRRGGPHRVGNLPAAMVEPGARVLGPLGDKAEEVGCGTLQPLRRGMVHAD